ncbi:MAG: peptide chain release factor N(5)-glutamine methyltransferase [Muribaculaceae bacterium]|nr:peptide chain release factor N(5)-glutamine methyltransferase [Muribaculaceae bacterium]
MNGNPVTVADLVRHLKDALSPRYGEGEAKAMIRLILHHLKGWSQTDIIINSDRPVSDYILEKTDAIISRLRNGEPLQYILGEARFYGMDLKVGPEVLIPRPETEELVDMIVKENSRSDLRILDIGTGSGAIAIALSRNLKFPHITAIDISGPALEIARFNAAQLHADITFLKRDIFNWLPEDRSFDMIVSNPPYIADKEKAGMEANVLDYEPHGALFVPDNDPLVYYRRIARIGRSALDYSGKIYFEINPLYADELVDFLHSEGYADVRVSRDISRRKRFICVRTESRK